MDEPFWRVRAEKRAVTLVRTARRMASPQEYIDSFGVAFAALKPLDRETFRLLVDLRLAIGRNDADFEAAVAKPRRELLSTFPKTALLLATHIGAMQVRRHLADDGLELAVFTDEADALRWLRRLDPPSPKPIVGR